MKQEFIDYLIEFFESGGTDGNWWIRTGNELSVDGSWSMELLVSHLLLRYRIEKKDDHLPK